MQFGGKNAGALTGMFTIDPESATRTYAGPVSPFAFSLSLFFFSKKLKNAQAYYFSNAKRPNLVLLTEARVSRILLERSANDDSNEEYLASGVEFIKSDKKYTVKAKREVIVCAGPFSFLRVYCFERIGDDKLPIKGLS